MRSSRIIFSRSSPEQKHGPLARSWIRSVDAVQAGIQLRIMHLNVLADCLAKSAPVFSRKKGFRCGSDTLGWGYRSKLLESALLEYECDIIGLCEVDRYEDFFEPLFLRHGFSGTFRRKRPPAGDGVAIFWKHSRFSEALRRVVFLEQGVRRTKAAQVALFQRLCILPEGRTIVICSTHFRAKAANDELRMQQASEVISAMSDFARAGEARLVLADVNSDAPVDADSGGATSSVLEYFSSCGFRCAYRSLGRALKKATSLPSYTTWAGWADGDYRAVCDHIFVSPEVHVAGVLDVPVPEKIEAHFPERLPNGLWPSDHMSLVTDVVIP